MSTNGKRFLGAATGAVICAVARFGVAIGFIYYVSSQGGKWWSGAQEFYWAASISALMGIPIGGVAGWTCKPMLGTVIGAALSGGTCFGLFVLPTEMMIGMSHPGGFDRVESLEVLGGFLAMIIAGAIAGGLGAAIGELAGANRDPNKTENSP